MCDKAALSRTIEGIVFDSVFVEPVRTRDREESARRSIAWTDRARSIARRLVDDEVQRTRALRRRESVDHFQSPVADARVGEEELIDGGDVGGVSTCESVVGIIESTGQRKMPTEEPDILVLGGLIEEAPLNEGRRAIDGAFVDMPRDVQERRALPETHGEESDLRGRIQQLELQIGDAQRGDHTAATKMSSSRCIGRKATHPMTTSCGRVTSTRTSR